MWTWSNPPDQSRRRRYRWTEKQCLYLRAAGMTPRRLAGTCGSLTWTNQTGELIGVLNWRMTLRNEAGYTLIIRAHSMGFVGDLRVDLRADTVADTGRERWWFCCPSCGARCRGLFKPPRQSVFQCRACVGVQYDSRLREPPKRVENKIRAWLDRQDQRAGIGQYRPGAQSGNAVAP